MNRLVIIGNGFDLYHGIESSYSNFKDFLSGENSDLYNMLETYIDVDDNELWSNIECNLKHFNIDSYVEDIKENASNYLVDYGSDEWRDCFNHDYGYEIDKSLEFYEEQFTEMRNLLLSWVNSIYEKWIYTEEKKLTLDNEAFFINFNYTLVLEDLYAINNVFHIHNSIRDGDLIFGCSHIEYNYKLKYTSDIRINECEEQFSGLNYYLEKNYNSGINDFCFENIKHLDILGHSLSEVDMIYFEKIFSKISNRENLEIRISYYNKKDKSKIDEFISTFNLNKENIIKIKLGDLQIK